MCSTPTRYLNHDLITHIDQALLLWKRSRTTLFPPVPPVFRTQAASERSPCERETSTPRTSRSSGGAKKNKTGESPDRRHTPPKERDRTRASPAKSPQEGETPENSGYLPVASSCCCCAQHSACMLLHLCGTDVELGIVCGLVAKLGIKPPSWFALDTGKYQQRTCRFLFVSGHWVTPAPQLLWARRLRVKSNRKRRRMMT